MHLNRENTSTKGMLVVLQNSQHQISVQCMNIGKMSLSAENLATNLNLKDKCKPQKNL